MTRLDMAIALLQEAKKQKELLEEFESDSEDLPAYGDPDRPVAVEAFYRKWRKIPKKSVINDNIKMARRLLLDEYM